MQGHLRDEELSIEIETECVCCGRAIHVTADHELRWSVEEPGARPLIFEPDVDWARLEAPTIVDDY